MYAKSLLLGVSLLCLSQMGLAMDNRQNAAGQQLVQTAESDEKAILAIAAEAMVKDLNKLLNDGFPESGHFCRRISRKDMERAASDDRVNDYIKVLEGTIKEDSERKCSSLFGPVSNDSLNMLGKIEEEASKHGLSNNNRAKLKDAHDILYEDDRCCPLITAEALNAVASLALGVAYGSVKLIPVGVGACAPCTLCLFGWFTHKSRDMSQRLAALSRSAAREAVTLDNNVLSAVTM